jgi:hypothetical protein
MIPGFEREKTAHTSDRKATVIGVGPTENIIIAKEGTKY